MALLTQTFIVNPAVDSSRRSIDPGGIFGSGTNSVEYTIPVVSLLTPLDQEIAKGSIYTATFSSTFAGHWDIKVPFDDYSVFVSSDARTATITWVTSASMIGESFHVVAKCKNIGGEGFAYDRVHVGVTNLLFAGVGETYSNLTTAFAAMVPGDTIILSDGTYAESDGNNMYLDFSDGDLHLPKSGIYTTDNSGTDPVYTFSQMSTVMSETPFGVVYDMIATPSSQALGLVGDTDLEADQNFSNFPFTGPNSTRRGIKITGFVIKNTQGSGASVLQADHIKFQYICCYDNGINYSSGPNNVANIGIQNSTDCLVEYCFGFGEGRYKVSTYQCKRSVVRRGLGRHDARLGGDPMACINLYRQRQGLVQNYLHLDSDSFDFWDIGDGYGNISFGGAATQAHDYPKEFKYDRVGTLNNQCGSWYNDAYDNPSTYTEFVFKDIWSHDIEIPQNSFSNNGPMVIDGFTWSRINNNGPTSFCNNYRSGNTLTNGVIVNMGWDGSAAASQGFLVEVGGSGRDEFWNYSDGYNYEFLGQLAPGGNPYTLTNINTSDNPNNRGFDYVGRIEEGSIIDGEGYGARNFYSGVGKAGTFYGDTDFELETSKPWLEKSCYELVRPHFRDYSYTGVMRDGGNGTLSGNRGWCRNDDDLIDYITAYTGKAPLLSCEASVVGTSALITWKYPASKHRTNITGVRVYLDGELAGTTSAAAFGLQLAGLVSGHTFKVQCVLIDSIKGDSGLSEPVLMEIS